MIDQYLPALWEYAQQELNPMVICPQLGLCPAEVERVDGKKSDSDSEEWEV